MASTRAPCGFGQESRQRAPAAPDFEHARPFVQPQPVRDRADLVGLRDVEFGDELAQGVGRAPRRGEDAARIEHRLAEPLFVEVVAEIVVRVDVAQSARARVAVKPVQELRRDPPWPLRAADIAKPGGIVHEQREDRHRIRTLPLALLPRLVPAHRSRCGQPQQRAPAMNMNDGLEARRPPTQEARLASRQGRFDGAALQPEIDPVENPGNAAGPYPGQPLRTYADGAATLDQLLSPAWRACVHDGDSIRKSSVSNVLEYRINALSSAPRRPGRVRAPSGARPVSQGSCVGARRFRDRGSRRRSVRQVRAPIPECSLRRQTFPIG